MTLTNLNGVSYTVKAKNDQERKEWLSAISQSIIHSMEKAKKEAPTIEKEGFLTKKGKRRYFVLQKGRLTWYLSEKVNIFSISK